MKIAQLIKETETHLFKNEDGEIINLTSEQKLMHSIFKPDAYPSYRQQFKRCFSGPRISPV